MNTEVHNGQRVAYSASAAVVSLLLILSSCAVEKTVYPSAEPGVSISLTVEPESVDQNDPIEVRVTLSNDTPRERTVAFAVQQQVGFEVLETSGTVVTSYPEVVSPVSSHITLAAGTSVILTATLYTNNLAPGTFILRGGLYMSDPEVPWIRTEITVR